MENTEKTKMSLAAATGFFAGAALMSWHGYAQYSRLRFHTKAVEQLADAATDYIQEMHDDSMDPAEASEKFETRMRFLNQIYGE